MPEINFQDVVNALINSALPGVGQNPTLPGVGQEGRMARQLVQRLTAQNQGGRAIRGGVANPEIRMNPPYPTISAPEVVSGMYNPAGSTARQVYTGMPNVVGGIMDARDQLADMNMSQLEKRRQWNERMLQGYDADSTRMLRSIRRPSTLKEVGNERLGVFSRKS